MNEGTKIALKEWENVDKHFKIDWPTLEGRLKHAPTSRLQAIKQLKASGMILTPLAQSILEKAEIAKVEPIKKKRGRPRKVFTKLDCVGTEGCKVSVETKE